MHSVILTCCLLYQHLVVFFTHSTLQALYRHYS